MLPFLLTWVQFTEITQLLVEFFVVKEHLRMASFSSLTTDKFLSTQKAWHGACNVDTLFSTKLLMMYDVVCGFQAPYATQLKICLVWLGT